MILSQSVLSRKYADAYLNVYESKITLDDIEKMESLTSRVKKYQECIVIMSFRSARTEQEKKKTVKLFFDTLDLSSTLRSLVFLLLEHKRFFLFSAILNDIAVLYKRRNNIEDLCISVSHKLSQKAIDQFVNFFKSYAKCAVLTSVQVDPSLIAGVRLQSNEYIWEYSIAKKIRAIRQTIIEG